MSRYGGSGTVTGSSSATDAATTEAGTGTGASTWTPNAATSPIYSNILENLGVLTTTEVPYYSGQTYVDPSRGTQEGVGMLRQGASDYGSAADAYSQASDVYTPAAQMYGQAAGAQQGMLGQAGRNYGFLSNAADVANNPYVQAMNANTVSNLNENLYKNVLPQVNAGAMDVNALGSSRQGIMQGQAIGDTQSAIADALTDTNLGAYNSGLGAQTSALGQTGAMLQNQTAPAQAFESAGTALQAGGESLATGAGLRSTGAENLLSAGNIVEGYQQTAIDDAVDRYNYQYEERWTRLGNVSDYLTGLFGDTGTAYTSETSGGQSVGASDTDTGGWSLSGGAGK